MKTRSVLAVAVLAGTACSATARTDDVVPVRGVKYITPSYIKYNGVTYPVQVTGTDEQQLVYDNNIGPFSSLTALPKKGLDDISLDPGPGAGAGRLINEVSVSWVIPGTVQSTTDLDVVLTLWDNLDGAATPVNTGEAGGVIIGFAGPFDAGFIYISNPVSLTALPGGGIQTLDDAFGAEYELFTADTTTFHPEATLGYANGAPAPGAPPQVGGSDAGYWRDVNGDGVYGSDERRVITGFTSGSNFRLRLGADVPPLATGACCIAGGTCSLVSQNSCINQGGIYAGDNTTCEAANCAATGACCLLDGTCSLFDNGTCVSLLNGIFKGANTTCGSNCPTVFTYTGGPVSIPDGTGTTTPICGTDAIASIVVPGPGVTMGAVDAAYFVQHTFQGDLTVTLTKGATSVILVDNVPFGNDNFGASGNDSDLFRSIDTAPRIYNPPAAGQDNVRGHWKPENPLSAFNGQNSSGTWELRVKDCFGQDTGSLFNFKLSISGATGPTCYANCDNSTNNPFLNVLDFNCFLNAFNTAQGLPPAQQVTAYGNCDGSTTAPVLNVLDFNCFLNRFNTGCSAP